MTETFLCADIGTSSLKGGVLDENGRLLFFRRIEFPWARSSRADWNPREWESALARFVAEVPSKRSLTGIALSGNGPTLAALDRGGDHIPPVLRWNDARSRPLPGEPSFFLPRIAWFRDEDPEAYAAASVFLCAAEYLVYRLGGDAAAVSPQLSFDPYLWNGAGASAYGIDYEKLPPITRLGACLGSVSAGGAIWSGLPVGIPLFAAGSDFVVSLLGTATVEPGLTCDRAGTSEGINCCSDAPVAAPGLRCLPHVEEGRFNIAGILSSTGTLFEWFRSLVAGQLDYDLLLSGIRGVDRRAGRSRADLPWFFPSLHAGASWEFSRGAFMGLGSDHGRDEMGYAVVESIAFAVREAVEIIEGACCPVDALRVTGGQAKNPIWNAMKATMTGKPVMVPEVRDAELVGNLACIAKGTGRAVTPAAAAAGLVRFAATFDPEPDLARHYENRYHEYRRRYKEVSAVAG